MPELQPSSSSRRLRVLVCANACSPARGSEAGIGWNIATRLARWCDVTALCSGGSPREPHRAEIEDHLRENPIDGFTPVFVDAPWILRLVDHRRSRLGQKIGRGLYYPGYAQWQRAALNLARRLHEKQPFDLAHHLTITGYREPGYLWKLPVPFVWGPVAGASNLPWRYFPLLGWQDRCIYGIRNLINESQKRFSPRPRRAARRAAHRFAVGPDSRRMIQDLWGCDCSILLENGGSDSPLAEVKRYDPASNAQTPLELIYAGLHIGRKGLPLAIEALALLGERPRVRLTLLGDGPERAALRQLAVQRGVADRVDFPGRVSHAQAQQRMSQAHAFVFPSLQEASATVTLEALSLGLPVLANACCGMAVAITPECGFPIPLSTPRQSARDFAAAIGRLATEPGLVQRLSEGALRRSKELSWDATARTIAGVYHQICGRDMPDSPGA